MNDLFDALDICLQEIENGAELESVLARYPHLAGELRPILKTAMKAKSASVPEPSAEAIRRGRARVLQQASVMREAQAAPRRRVIPAFQRLAISFSLVALLLMSSTGLLSASASALPGENLYPVKRGWENIRLFLVFDQQARKLLEYEFENERLHEVSELLSEGRGETIQFAGIFMQLNNMTYVSGVPVLLPPGMDVPPEGAAVVVSGITNSQGIVEIISLELMPEGMLVPEGKPVEVELSDIGPGGEALYEIEGILDAVSINTLVIEDITVYLENPTDWQLCIGMLVEVKGYYAADGRFMAVEVEGKGSCSHQQVSPPEDEDSGGGSNTNESVDVNTNDNGNDTNSNDVNTNDSNSNDSNDNDGVNDNGGGNGNSNDGGSEDNNDSGDGDPDDDGNSGGGSNDNGDSGGEDLNENDDSGGDTNINGDDSGGGDTNDNSDTSGSNDNLSNNDNDNNNNNSNNSNDSNDNDSNDNDSNDNDSNDND